jgi:sodium-dependent dicarboxylate transporter 2/3/5
MIYFLLRRAGCTHELAFTALTAAWLALWWITEAIDIGAASLLPLVLFPLGGVMDMNDTAYPYFDQTIFLFMGGFMMAYAMEKYCLHERIAFFIIIHTGSKPSLVLLGIMLSTFILSMWISNTATTMMLISAVTAILYHEHLYHQKGYKNISVAFLLGLAYSASIGGMSTLIGTPPNMAFAGFYSKMYPEAEAVSFVKWFSIAFPFSLLLSLMAYILLRLLYIPKKYDTRFDLAFIRDSYAKLGKIKLEEKWVMIVFGCAVLLWFTRAGIHIGNLHIKGWSSLFPESQYIKDSTVAIMAALLLFLIPSKEKGKNILEWHDVLKLPLRIILLFGNGFALAEAFERSGLAQYLAAQLLVLQGAPLIIILLAVAVLVTIISEFASNIASVQLILPVLASLSLSLQVEPLLVMIPATLAASFGYMMPVATAANTIVYSTGKIPVGKMMLTGLCLNVIAIILMVLYMSLLLGMD